MPCLLRAQTNEMKAAPQPDRYLLIVETSKSMQRREDPVLEIVQDMLMSGLDGQFRDGDTLGVWTFNEDLSAGHLPLQTWFSSERQNITQRVLALLRGQKYEKQANYDKVAPALGRVISDSRRLTVILISSGDWKMRGTPFDDRINGSYQQWREQQRKARLPFVTILCARKGELGAYAVNTPPWPLQVPHLAEEPTPTAKPRVQPLEVLRNAPTSNIAPLIISGKKLQAEPVPMPKPAPVAATNQTAPLEAAAVVTNQLTTVKLPAPAAPPLEIPTARPPTVVPDRPATEPPPNPAPAPIPASEPKPELVKAPEQKATEPAPAKPEAPPTPPAPVPKPEPVVVEQPKPTAAPEVKAAESVAAATSEAPFAANPSTTAVQATTSAPSTVTPAPPSRLAPRAQSATAAPAESLLHARNIWIAALLLAAVAVGVVLLRMRRARAAPQGSLITRSFEREKKQ